MILSETRLDATTRMIVKKLKLPVFSYKFSIGLTDKNPQVKHPPVKDKPKPASQPIPLKSRLAHSRDQTLPTGQPHYGC